MPNTECVVLQCCANPRGLSTIFSNQWSQYLLTVLSEHKFRLWSLGKDENIIFCQNTRSIGTSGSICIVKLDPAVKLTLWKDTETMKAGHFTQACLQHINTQSGSFSFFLNADHISYDSRDVVFPTNTANLEGFKWTQRSDGWKHLMLHGRSLLTFAQLSLRICTQHFTLYFSYPLKRNAFKEVLPSFRPKLYLHAILLFIYCFSRWDVFVLRF